VENLQVELQRRQHEKSKPDTTPLTGHLAGAGPTVSDLD
jgi:hypothetical protein